MSRGYFAIGIYQPKFEINVGTLWRTANLYCASMLFTIGKRYTPNKSDKMSSDKHIPLVHFNNIEHFLEANPLNIPIIGIEMDQRARVLHKFNHPESAWYLLGAEDDGLPKEVINELDHVVQIPTLKDYSMNVSVAGSIVLYDRFIRGQK